MKMQTKHTLNISEFGSHNELNTFQKANSKSVKIVTIPKVIFKKRQL